MENEDAIPNSPVIEMSGVTVGTLANPEQVVLEDVNWTVNAHEFWVVAGMHGAGKGDLMSLTAGLMPPRAGDYRLFGYQMPMFREDQLPERLRLGLVAETGHLLHQLTLRENISLPLRYHRKLPWQEIERRVNTMLDLMELTPRAEEKPGMVGRYWQRRTALARALMLEPEVLLLDQPLNGLDRRQGTWWLKLLEQLSKGHPVMSHRPMTLVVTTEDLRPWHTSDCHFALVEKRRFTSLGYRPQFAGRPEPLVKELLAEGFSRG
jgi:ABC-type transporter Mla maintaining outer membrane lipid asymmetry ATPase subunit MlaF